MMWPALHHSWRSVTLWNQQFETGSQLKQCLVGSVAVVNFSLTVSLILLPDQSGQVWTHFALLAFAFASSSPAAAFITWCLQRLNGSRYRSIHRPIEQEACLFLNRRLLFEIGSSLRSWGAERCLCCLSDGRRLTHPAVAQTEEAIHQLPPGLWTLTSRAQSWAPCCETKTKVTVLPPKAAVSPFVCLTVSSLLAPTVCLQIWDSVFRAAFSVSAQRSHACVPVFTPYNTCTLLGSVYLTHPLVSIITHSEMITYIIVETQRIWCVFFYTYT